MPETARIAAIGDTHIPGRAKAVPLKLMRALRDFSPERILLTGDLTSLSVLREMEAIAHTDAVLGERDFLELPEQAIFRIGGVKFALIHGNQVRPAGNVSELENLARFFEADVLVSGHSHSVSASKGAGALLINPGSATGVRLPGEPEYACNPSMILLEAGAGRTVTARIVELAGASRHIERTFFFRF